MVRALALMKDFQANFTQGMIPRLDLELVDPASGETNYKMHSIPPENIISFNYQRVIGGVSNQVSFVVFSNEPLELEGWLVASMLKKGALRFRWGYYRPTGYAGDVEALVSDWHSGMLIDYEPEFLYEGANMTLKAISSIDQGEDRMIGSYLDSAIEGVVPEDLDDAELPEDIGDIYRLESSINPSRVAKQLIEKAGWKVGKIDPSETVETGQDVILPNVNVLEFLETLAGYAERPDGQTGFQVAVEDRVDDDGIAIPKVHFRVPGYATDDEDAIQGEFNYWRGLPQRNGKVNLLLRFRPKFNAALSDHNMAMGNEVDSVSYQDSDSNEMTIDDVDGVTGAAPRAPKNNAYAPEVSMTQDEARKLAKNTNDMGVYTAEMEIIGFPHIKLLEPIKVNVIPPEGGGAVHHTSGAYTITNATDSIQGGRYTISLSGLKWTEALSGYNRDKEENPGDSRTPGGPELPDSDGTLGDVPFYKRLIPSDRPNSGREMDSPHAPKGIVIHNTANTNDSALGYVTYLNESDHPLRPNRPNVAWHFSVDHECIVQHAPTRARLVHAGAFNDEYIGIEICMGSHGEDFLQAEYNAALLGNHLARNYLLPGLDRGMDMFTEGDIVKHSEDPSGTDPQCPFISRNEPGIGAQYTTVTYQGIEFVTMGFQEIKKQILHGPDRSILQDFL